MRVSNNHVRLAATNALLNSLEFTRLNFEQEVNFDLTTVLLYECRHNIHSFVNVSIQVERNYIMEVVCEATQSEDTQVKVAALQCLVKIMTLYYQYMEPYMGQALFPVSFTFCLVLVSKMMCHYF